jgi:hypothetical protein
LRAKPGERGLAIISSRRRLTHRAIVVGILIAHWHNRAHRHHACVDRLLGFFDVGSPFVGGPVNEIRTR